MALAMSRRVWPACWSMTHCCRTGWLWKRLPSMSKGRPIGWLRRSGCETMCSSNFSESPSKTASNMSIKMSVGVACCSGRGPGADAGDNLWKHDTNQCSLRCTSRRTAIALPMSIPRHLFYCLNLSLRSRTKPITPITALSHRFPARIPIPSTLLCNALLLGLFLVYPHSFNFMR